MKGITMKKESLTMSFDWEIAILKEDYSSIGEKKLTEFSKDVGLKLPWASIGIDFDLIEIRPGIVRNFSELSEKIDTLTDVLFHRAEKKGYIVFPAGMRPAESEFAGAHVHVGTFPESSLCVRVNNAIYHYLGLFSALSVNTPLFLGKKGIYKSHRLAYNANFCSRPAHPLISGISDYPWGEEASIRLPNKSTVEIRSADSPSSRRFMLEYATLIVATFYSVLENIAQEENWTQFDLRRYAENRFNASRHGLCGFYLEKDGSYIKTSDRIKEHIASLEAGLYAFGADVNDLFTISQMLEKRYTQADFLLEMFEREKEDAFRLTSTMATVFRDMDFFGKALKNASKRPVVENTSDSMKEFILEHISRRTPVTYFFDVTPLHLLETERFLRNCLMKKELFRKLILLAGLFTHVFEDQKQ